MKELPKDKYKGFYIWFDKDKKIGYYTTSMYLYNIDYKLDKEDNGLELFYKKCNFDGVRKQLNWEFPFKENLGLMLTRFLNTDFNDFESAYKTFFFAYGFEYLKEYAPNVHLLNTYKKEKDLVKALKELFEKVKEDLIYLQKSFREAVDQIYGLDDSYDESTANLSTNSKFIASIITKKNDLWEYCDKTEVFLGDYAEMCKQYLGKDYKDIATKIDNGDIFINKHHIYTSESFGNILYLILEQLVKLPNMPIKKCASCGKYFIPSNRQDEIYCEFADENEKTCKEKGALKTYKKNIENIPGLLLYRRTYQKRLMEISRNNDTELQEKQRKKFDKWKKQAQEKIKEFKAGKLTEDGLYDWMVENKGK